MKNYSLKFALSITLFIIAPILLVTYVLIAIFTIIYGDMTIDKIYTMVLPFFGCLALAFLIVLLIGYITSKIYEFKIIEKRNSISNGQIELRKADLIKIKARRFLLLYSFDIYSKPFKSFSSMSFYFNTKDELIKFINKIDDMDIKKLIRESDLVKLGIKE